MVTIKSYLNNIESDSVSGSEKYLLSLLFIFISYYFFPIALSQFCHTDRNPALPFRQVLLI